MQVVAEHPLRLAALWRLVGVGDHADRHAAARDVGGNTRLFPALLKQIVDEAQADGLPAGNDIVELAGKARLVAGAARHPHVDPVRLAHEAVEMHSAGANAQRRAGGAFDLHKRRRLPIRRNRIQFLTPGRNLPLLGKLPQRAVERCRARLEAVEPLVHMHRVLADAENGGPARQRQRQGRAHETHPRSADIQRPEAGWVEVVAGVYVVEIGHGSSLLQSAVSA